MDILSIEQQRTFAPDTAVSRCEKEAGALSVQKDRDFKRFVPAEKVGTS